ncbi:MAG: hypothetical protein E7172_06395 [Firmicutes bacterium]|nr:hypothetical protein [Bacillota bacterium]
MQERYDDGVEDGIEKGIEKGIAQGIEKGIEQNKITVAKNMLKKNIDMTDIVEITGLSEKRIKMLM